MHSLGNNPNYPKMKNQLNAREDDQEKGAYQSNLQKELGLAENPDPSQPVLILEKTNKDILKPRTANVTAMKAKSAKDAELENEIMEQQFLKEYNHPFGRENLMIEPNLDEGNTRKTVNESSSAANNEDRVPKGLKNITALQTKSNRFDSSYNDKKITHEINKEYGVDLEDNPEEGGRLLILGPPRNPMKDVTGKNQNISSMKKQGSIHYYHEKEVLDKEFYENQEETKLFQDDDELFNRKKGMKSPSRPNTASRIPTNHEQQIMKELDEELQDEVMIDQMKLTSSINNNNFLRTSQPRPTSMQNRDSSNRNNDKAKEEIIVAAMANQNSEKELRKSLSKNQNQLSQGELIFEKTPNKQKTISNPTGFKTTTDRIESATEKQIKQELLRNSTEELILQPRPLEMNNIKNKTSSLASKETRIPNTREKQFGEKLDKEFQEELILDNNNPSTLRKSSSNASPMKNSATKIKTPSEMNAERQFQKTIDESVSPNTMKRQLSSKKGTADNSNNKKKETNSSSSLKTKNTATSRNPSISSVSEKKMSGKEKSSSAKEKEDLKIETPVLNAPRISERTPVQKESFQLNKLEDKLKELNLE
jgi:hypothetical protein